MSFGDAAGRIHGLLDGVSHLFSARRSFRLTCNALVDRDQLCSMTFTLSHLATFGCAYFHQFQDAFPENLNVTCGTVTNMWGVELVLLCVPQVFRFVQSVKRYVDTPMYMHLVNVSSRI